jgi:hypothetical protein
MRKGYRGLVSVGLLSLALFSLPAIASADSKGNADSIVITFKDGHQQTFSMSDISQIEFKSPSDKHAANRLDLPGRPFFVGKWTVGDNQGHTYTFTFSENGEATNTVESGGRGIWTYVDGEVHVTWENGWHDVIRKVGSKYRKFAYEPGRSFDDSPSNTGEAHKTNAEPI